MSLLIKGMAIPKDSNLANMILLRDGDGQWRVGIRDSVRDIKDIQWHEVVEIKVPHGRLIDADELVRIWTGAKFYGNIKPIVDARPTVIEAEGSET